MGVDHSGFRFMLHFISGSPTSRLLETFKAVHSLAPSVPDTLMGLLGRPDKCTLIPGKNSHITALPLWFASPTHPPSECQGLP